MLKLAAFLGNPGRKYSKNRHNAGRMLAEALPFYSSLSWQKKFKGLYAVKDNIHFIMPETYMNLSGESVLAAASFYKIEIGEIIVIHDELELPLGTISLKFSGGLGGHNGLRSMKACFGSADFWRLRIGLGRPEAQAAFSRRIESNSLSSPTAGRPNRLPDEGGHEGSGEGIVDWVLSDFLNSELETLIPTLDAGANLLMQTFTEEPEVLLKDWAKKKIIIPKKSESIEDEPI